MSARGSGANETYVDAARRGKQTWWRYLLGILFILFMWFIVGFAASAALGSVLGISATKAPTNPSGAELIKTFLVTIVPFITFFLGTVLAVVWIHRRNALTLVTAGRSIDWRRVGTGFGVWFAVLILSGIVSFLISPSSISLGPSLLAFVPFAILAVVLLPIQTTSEELFNRGYLVQGASLISGNFVFLAVVSGVAFTIPHLTNPEAVASFLPSVAYYFGFGAFMAWVSLKDGTIELAIGAHAANNLFLATVLTYSGAALTTPALFQTNVAPNAWSGLITFVIFAALFYVAVFVLFKRRPTSRRNLS